MTPLVMPQTCSLLPLLTINNNTFLWIAAIVLNAQNVLTQQCGAKLQF